MVKQFDLCVLDVTGRDSPAALDIIGANGPRACRGLQKAACRFALKLLAPGAPFAPVYGLVDALASGSMSDEGAIRQAADSAAGAALDAVRASDGASAFGDLPDDERLVSARVSDVAVDPETRTVAVRVELKTAAGDSAVYVIPASVP